MKTPHKHAEIIRAWADGAEIEHRCAEHLPWVNCKDAPSWSDHIEYRIKPEPPKYPQTNLSDAELEGIIRPKGFIGLENYPALMRDIANASIARAIEDGQVVVPDGDRDAQDMAIAQEVRREFLLRCEPIGVAAQMALVMDSIDLAAIIAYVREGGAA